MRKFRDMVAVAADARAGATDTVLDPAEHTVRAERRRAVLAALGEIAHEQLGDAGSDRGPPFLPGGHCAGIEVQRHVEGVREDVHRRLHPEPAPGNHADARAAMAAAVGALLYGLIEGGALGTVGLTFASAALFGVLALTDLIGGRK